MSPSNPLRDSVVSNLTDFFERFRTLNIRSNEDLDSLVHRARLIVSGIKPQSLRNDLTLRERVAGQLGQVQSALDTLMVDRPRRRIIRCGRAPETS